MKALITALCLTASFGLLAQAPPRMSYQAVIRDASNALIVNDVVGMRLSVLQGSASGTAVYMETHTTTTNANGLATAVIGSGAVVSGSVSNVDWATGPYFLKTETDPNGGTNYTISGTSELMSVPYALHAANSEPGPPGPQGIPGVGGCDPNNRDSLIVLYNSASAYGFYQDPDGVGHWVVHPLGNTNHSAISSKRGVVIYNNATAHAFYLDNSGVGTWSEQTLGNTNYTALAADHPIVLYNNTTAWAFHVDGGGQGTWTTQAIGNTGHSHIAHGGKAVVWNNATSWAFSVADSGGGSWVSQALGNTTMNVITTR